MSIVEIFEERARAYAEADRRAAGQLQALMLTPDEAAKLKLATMCGAGECQITDEDEAALDRRIDELTVPR